MIFFISILLMMIAGSATAAKPNEFNKDYISKDSIQPIKGIFIILVLLSHSRNYTTFGGVYDKPYLALQNHLGQMIVAMFLFYSGYGIMEQIKKKEWGYVGSIPTKRFAGVLLNFDIAILLYLILNICLGKPLETKQVLLSFIGLRGMGNSSWYIFDVLVLYLATFIAFLPVKKWNSKWVKFAGIVIVSAFSGAFIVIMKRLNYDTYWYNTVPLYALGMFYSFFKDEIEKVLFKNDIIYLSACSVVSFVYIASFLTKVKYGIPAYILWSFMFTAAIVLFTMKVKISSNILAWFGEHLFGIYILHRIPMIIMAEYGISERHKYAFLIIAFPVAAASAAIFDYLTGKLSNKIWNKKMTA